MARILILTHEFYPFRGGIGAVAHGLAAGAAEMAHEPIVHAPDYGQDQVISDESLPYRVSRFPGRTCSIVSVDGIARYTLRCLGAIRRIRPDVVHAVDPAAHMALSMLGRLHLIREHFFTVHGTELVRYRSEPFPRLCMGGAFRRVRAVAAVSRAMRDVLIENFPEAAERAFVSYPGIAQEWLVTPAHDPHAWRSRWRVGQDDIAVLTLARRVREKGHDRVIAAIAALPADLRARIVCFIAGDGPTGYARELEQAAAAGDVRLTLLGPVSDRAAIELCDSCDVFAMPSRRTPKRIEGFGIAFLEAGARGLPSITTATGGTREAVRDGETGIVVPEDADTTALAGALRTLASQPELRQRLGRNARTFARDFTWARHAAEVYSRFLAALD